MSIAPWQVHLCCLRSDDENAKSFADSLYKDLQNDGVEVIYDDRNVRPGVMFSDADLLGVPVRVIVSPRNMSARLLQETNPSARRFRFPRLRKRLSRWFAICSKNILSPKTDFLVDNQNG